MSIKKRVNKAVSLYRRFTGHDPKYIDRYAIPFHDVTMQIGQLEGVMYETVRDGVREKYFHRFSKRARPILAASFDGQQLYVIGGDYNFTDEGITDK